MVLTESERKLNAGDKAPSFVLKGTDGKSYDSRQFLGKPLLVIFMCNHCPYVKAKIGAIKNLHEKFTGKINVAGINSNDPDYEGEGMENMKKFAIERGIKFPYLFDETQEIAKAYGATCTPDPFLFNSEGRLIYHGRIDNALTLESIATEKTMEISIISVLEGKKVVQAFQPSMGCSIKWK